MDRRRFLKTSSLAHVALVGVSGCASTGGASDEVEKLSAGTTVPTGQSPFQHGVASGDPLQDRVILWTRVSPSSSTDADISVDWWIGTEPTPSGVVRRGTGTARAERDFTLKIDAAGLSPDTRYFYGFTAGDFASPVGRTRTLPSHNVREVRLAVTSCANYPQGYFNAYRDIANTEDLHAVLSLGDYLYEYGNSEYGNGEALDRIPAPDHEIVSLGDYRTRHAQYKSDGDLQAAHAAHPWIVIWDDHESTNNSWSGGAQNHNPEAGEGAWDVRRDHAIMAYYEWMPIREVPTGLFRSFRFGNLADLVMLDTRLEGRDEQGGREDFDVANDSQRSLLGPIQESLFFNHLSTTQADDVRWKLVGQQVVFAPWTDGKTPFNPDSWEGYRGARARVLDHIEDEGIENVVILSGDVHSAWGMEVPDVNGEGSQAIELVAPAVSSPPLASTSEAMQNLVARALDERAHIKYADGMSNGYLTVVVDQDRTRAEWRFTGDRTERNGAVLGSVLECAAGTNTLTPA
ncbi:MAG: alkaline phosphatase [Pseudomonadales bacterium]|nr:alkaline phosphatase [Pseudomonadales bacterium]